jgi:hypothetical protein
VSFTGEGGYEGSGACGNVYEFVLYALDTATFAAPGSTDPDDVQAALDESTALLGTATMRGRSDPNGPTCGND